MKSVFVTSVLLAVAYGLSTEDTQKLKMQMLKMGQDCQGQTGASSDDVNQIMKKTVPVRKEGKCLIYCVHKKIGFQDGAGKIDAPGIDTWVEQMKTMDADMGGKARLVADKCIPNVDDNGDGCETAGAMFDCYMKEAKVMGVPMMFR